MLPCTVDVFECPGLYRCEGATQCIALSQVCDGESHCPRGEDENHCFITCPQYCDCLAYDINCTQRNLTQLPMHITSQARSIDLSKNDIVYLMNSSFQFSMLATLDVSYNRIVQLIPGIFYRLNNLRILDLGFNEISELKTLTFQGLVTLERLNLKGNDIHVLQPGSFIDLVSLPTLDCSHMSISRLVDETFVGLGSLLQMNLSHNGIVTISSGALTGLHVLSQLDLRANDLKTVFSDSLAVLPHLEFLQSDHFKLCCMATQVSPDNCFPPQDPISSCGDLMQNNILRSFIWILGVTAVFGNIGVVIWRVAYKMDSVPDLIITHLAVSDLLMGIYMLIIAAVDLYYQGVFIEYSDQWQDSGLCSLAGFLATYSSEASVMFLCLLTIDRFINIIFPFSSVKLTKTSLKVYAFLIWLVAFVISALPLFPLEYFGPNYYGRSGVCMALPITNEKPAGICQDLFLLISYINAFQYFTKRVT